jgi:DNA-binding XRE family transcriptional regulator
LTIKLKNPREFKIIIVKKGFTQRSLGKAAGVSDTTINHLLNEKRGCGPSVAYKVCQTLQVEFDDIFFIDDACNSQRFSTGTDGQ